jgi:hypothetical protein
MSDIFCFLIWKRRRLEDIEEIMGLWWAETGVVGDCSHGDGVDGEMLLCGSRTRKK